MKKLISIAMLAVIAFSLIVGCSNATPTIESISIKTQPANTSYRVGDRLDLSGMVVEVKYTNGIISEIPSGKYTTVPENGSILSNEGTNDVTVSYTESKITKSDAFSIIVKAADKAEPAPTDCIAFTSNAQFTVSVNNPGWRFAPGAGVIQFSTDKTTWLPDLNSAPEGWDGSPVTSGETNKLYFRGKGNTVITGSDTNYWDIGGTDGSVSVSGNMMAMLDYENSGAAAMNAYCFAYIFNGQAALINASGLALPATSLSNYCYKGMFDSCTSLKSGPALPASTLKEGCYKDMFRGCISLAKAPELPAETLTADCYSNMFNGCSSLKVGETASETDIPAGGTKIFIYPAAVTNAYVGGMFAATGGTFAGTPTAGKTYYWYAADPPAATNYITFSGNKPFTIATANSAVSWNGTLYYSTDALEWNYWDGTSVSSSSDNKLYLRGKGNSVITGEFKNQWVIGGSAAVSVSGNIMTLLDYKSPDTATIDAYCFANMFNDQSALTDASDLILPATTLAPYCYNGMFSGCVKLAKFPALPATTLAPYCYAYMFEGCGGLTKAPVLPATALAESCYGCMFSNCISLTTAPELPATTLASDCYSGMFSGCTKLAKAPDLPVKTLAPGCYFSMFSGCASLTKAPALPAKTLAPNCYNGMFSGCIRLTESPALPATTLADYCYYGMFEGCTSLETAPTLPVKTLTDKCYALMFKGCSNLKVGRVASESEIPVDGTKIFSCPGDATISQVGDMFTATGGAFTSTPIPGSTYYRYTVDHVTFSSNEPFTIKTSNSAKNWNGTLYYSTDASEWKSWNGTSVSSGSENKLYFRGTGNSVITGESGNYWAIGGSAAVSVSGNIMALLDYENPGAAAMGSYCFACMFNKQAALTDASGLVLPATTLATVCYANMFDGCTKLTAVPALPATTLMERCYEEMFCNCESLTQAPELPATALASDCYTSMFEGCKKLATAPDLPATTLKERCYRIMFCRCESLTQAPELPAMSLAEDCYANMFESCTSLRTAPELSATTLAEECYANMFGNCRSLERAPELPATVLADCCYTGMFDSCTSLITAPELPAKTLTRLCYGYMFNGCTSLKAAPVLPATTLADMCYNYMFNDCTSIETAPELPAVTLTYACYKNMFSDCTRLTTVPALSATTLDDRCYYHMFSGCTSIKTAPALPATDLAESCYESMFSGCTSLTLAPELPATTLKEACYKNMFSGCTSLAELKYSSGETPVLPAPTLAKACYYEMFKGCVLLKKCEIIATSFAEDLSDGSKKYGCMQGMFEGCENFNYLAVHFTDWGSGSTANATKNWLSGVAGLGTFACPSELNTNIRDESHVPTAWGGIMSYLTFTGTNVQVTPSKGWEAKTKEYSIDGGVTWYSTDKPSRDAYHWDGTSSTPSASSVMFRGLGGIYGSFIGWDHTEYAAWVIKGTDVSVSGNVMTLLDYQSPSTTISYDNCFNRMFYNQTSLVDATKLALPATDLSIECYRGMFEGCTSLKTAPILPATLARGACYEQMFKGCTSLTEAPALPAKELLNNCYEEMFNGCTSLTKAPELPATELAYSTYEQMFEGCISLTEAPELPATTIYGNCYDAMFKGCISLTQAPELPATQLAEGCYSSMFEGCTNLVTAPALPAGRKDPVTGDQIGALDRMCYCKMFSGCTSLKSCEIMATTLVRDLYKTYKEKYGCVQEMFAGCTALNSLTVHFTDWRNNDSYSENATLDWLKNAGSAGTNVFNCPSELDTTTRNASRVPAGWTVVNP